MSILTARFLATFILFASALAIFVVRWWFTAVFNILIVAFIAGDNDSSLLITDSASLIILLMLMLLSLIRNPFFLNTLESLYYNISFENRIIPLEMRYSAIFFCSFIVWGTKIKSRG